MFWTRFIDLQNFILLVCTVPFFGKLFFISSYTEKNNYFLLYELIQDLPYIYLYISDQFVFIESELVTDTIYILFLAILGLVHFSKGLTRRIFVRNTATHVVTSTSNIMMSLFDLV